MILHHWLLWRKWAYQGCSRNLISLGYMLGSRALYRLPFSEMYYGLFLLLISMSGNWAARWSCDLQDLWAKRALYLLQNGV
jgi:hypothetical protein